MTSSSILLSHEPFHVSSWRLKSCYWEPITRSLSNPNAKLKKTNYRIRFLSSDIYIIASKLVALNFFPSSPWRLTFILLLQASHFL